MDDDNQEHWVEFVPVFNLRQAQTLVQDSFKVCRKADERKSALAWTLDALVYWAAQKGAGRGNLHVAVWKPALAAPSCCKET